MTIPAYLKMFQELAVLQWLETAIKSFPQPGPETMLGQWMRETTRLGAVHCGRYTDRCQAVTGESGEWNSRK